MILFVVYHYFLPPSEDLSKNGKLIPLNTGRHYVLAFIEISSSSVISLIYCPIVYSWPSFRAEEVISDNLKLDDDGLHVYSACGTYLGGYQPDSAGPRWCIDLSCVAGLAPSGKI